MKTCLCNLSHVPTVLCLWLVTSVPASAQLYISRPNFGVPEFTQPGGTFRTEIKTSAGLTNTLWNAVLTNDLRAWTGMVEQLEYGLLADHNTSLGYRLTIRVPPDISPEVFKLIVSHPDSGSATNVNALSVVQNIETNFYILHYADPQAGGFEPDKPESGMCGKHGSIREIYWHAPAIRLMNPRFLFDTGDELDDPYYAGSVTNYQQYIDAMCQMGVPVLVTRGNNDDMISIEDWRRTIGIETYSIAIGSFYVCQKDYNENHFTPWFTNDYAASFTNPSVQFRLFGQHFSDSGSSWLPPAGQEPDLMLVGHIHVNSIVQSDPYCILSTEAAFNKGAVSLIEFLRSPTNWSCTSLTHLSAAQFQVMSSGAVARIHNTFAYSNDGSVFTNTATIVNQLPNRFWNGRIRFLMPFSSAGYDVSNGVKLAEYLYHNGSNLAVLVQVDIAPNTTTKVGIQPAAETAHIVDWTDNPSWTFHFYSSSHRLYSLLCCSNLADGVWTSVAGMEPRLGTGGADQMSFPHVDPSQFFRLNVALP